MATHRVTRVKKHITLSAEVAAGLEAEARVTKVTVSEVIEARVRDTERAERQGPSVLETRVEQLVMDMTDLRAKVLPLVATVTALLRQIEGEWPVKMDTEADATPPRIVIYEEMYGPITPTPVSEPPPDPVAPTPRKGWRPW
jgi:hypothetical protein